MNLHEPAGTGAYERWGKRAFDFFASAAGLLLLSPFLALIALLVRLTSPGPAFYRQERVGWNGRRFKIVKFRSMVRDADQKGPPITAARDARVTGLGEILRRTKIDELPQLWNVLKGEMSLVGPRPELPRYVATYAPEQQRILSVRPGITDTASIRYRREETLLPASGVEMFYQQQILAPKLALDLAYLNRITFARDLALILQTLRSVWGPGPASGDPEAEICALIHDQTAPPPGR